MPFIHTHTHTRTHTSVRTTHTRTCAGTQVHLRTQTYAHTLDSQTHTRQLHSKEHSQKQTAHLSSPNFCAVQNLVDTSHTY